MLSIVLVLSNYRRYSRLYIFMYVLLCEEAKSKEEKTCEGNFGWGGSSWFWKTRWNIEIQPTPARTRGTSMIISCYLIVFVYSLFFPIIYLLLWSFIDSIFWGGWVKVGFNKWYTLWWNAILNHSYLPRVQSIRQFVRKKEKNHQLWTQPLKPCTFFLMRIL